MFLAGWLGRLPLMGYASWLFIFSVISAYHLFEKISSCRNYNSSSCWDSRWMKRSGVILKSDPSAYVLLFKPDGQPLSSIKVDQ
ncbi:hypothetical protein D8674_025838 [Pyrus ussuriensis x Pyrus communis]|uniref:Uncharacterized protein n=1 Tax=Pyrus ussuriensis x Pyrus communis TaxID=2448454 RepID=A0A5N5IJB0_9ROSA|nr:hypothetical protein D8674_025838 [Pyrus ussuriensis x Pyrus communis]